MTEIDTLGDLPLKSPLKSPKSPFRRTTSFDEEPIHDDFQLACMEAHNSLRKERGVPEFAWSNEAARSAMNWAQNVADKGYIQHSDNQVMGENILIATQDIKGDDVVLKWLEEEEKYNYDLERWQRGTSRFTQMVWRSSSEFGIAKVPLRDKQGFAVVAHYRPRGNGNKPGEYAKNVPQKSDDTV